MGTDHRDAAVRVSKVTLRVLHINLRDEDVQAKLESYLSDVAWSVIDGRTNIDVYVSTSDLVCAAVEVANRVHIVLAQACVDQVDDELCGVSDISSRTGINRETIRSWTNGSRGPGKFPVPVGSLGGGTRGSAKVWRWRDVNEWLFANYSLGDSFAYPTQSEVAAINFHLARLQNSASEFVQNGPRAASILNLSSIVSIAHNERVHIVYSEPSLRGELTLGTQNLTMGSTR